MRLPCAGGGVEEAGTLNVCPGRGHARTRQQVRTHSLLTACLPRHRDPPNAFPGLSLGLTLTLLKPRLDEPRKLTLALTRPSLSDEARSSSTAWLGTVGIGVQGQQFRFSGLNVSAFACARSERLASESLSGSSSSLSFERKPSTRVKIGDVPSHHSTESRVTSWYSRLILLARRGPISAGACCLSIPLNPTPD